MQIRLAPRTINPSTVAVGASEAVTTSSKAQVYVDGFMNSLIDEWNE